MSELLPSPEQDVKPKFYGRTLDDWHLWLITDPYVIEELVSPNRYGSTPQEAAWWATAGLAALSTRKPRLKRRYEIARGYVRRIALGDDSMEKIVLPRLDAVPQAVRSCLTLNGELVGDQPQLDSEEATVALIEADVSVAIVTDQLIEEATAREIAARLPHEGMVGLQHYAATGEQIDGLLEAELEAMGQDFKLDKRDRIWALTLELFLERARFERDWLTRGGDV